MLKLIELNLCLCSYGFTDKANVRNSSNKTTRSLYVTSHTIFYTRYYFDILHWMQLLIFVWFCSVLFDFVWFKVTSPSMHNCDIVLYLWWKFVSTCIRVRNGVNDMKHVEKKTVGALKFDITAFVFYT